MMKNRSIRAYTREAPYKNEQSGAFQEKSLPVVLQQVHHCWNYRWTVSLGSQQDQRPGVPSGFFMDVVPQKTENMKTESAVVCLPSQKRRKSKAAARTCVWRRRALNRNLIKGVRMD
jgi:hypothetical protein